VISHLPYKNKLVYMIQTKESCELSDGSLRDIDGTLYEYGKKCVENMEQQMLYWRKKAIGV
jgi:hypothetical protein